MYKVQSSSVAWLAQVFNRFSFRLKSTGGRPAAPLGSRILTDADDIFKHNMWDHVQWTEEDRENFRQKAEENSCIQIPLKEQGRYDKEACQYWDRFYQTHQNKFFKDRKWLFLEFPELLPSGSQCQATSRGLGDERGPSTPTGSRTGTETRQLSQNCPIDHHRHADTPDPEESDQAATQTAPFPGQRASFRILEIGCGVGNSVIPIIDSIKDTDAFLYCCDFSPRAIQLLKVHPAYDESTCHAFVHDICEDASFPFPTQSLDVILAVFVLSSIHPDRIQGIVNRLSTYLKHGGVFLFRDYGRYDFSQLRFKKGRCLSENFYTRGDGTCVYFFSKDVHGLFSNAGLEEVQNLEDRRLQVNRGKKVVMHRVWMQSKYRKMYPLSSS
ncbi:tRNA N(3)-methylcytidine methyltransferase METTL8, mitochondrial isoform X2 [Antennarius striatus]|uniref:tRNA N(3)-methylcytidine methyltransferase METTL8, mitochondrial isoform X2 n=1 Tax=Antennarius striatus TaxID=241820 RepID=UPI0035B4CADD